MAYPSLSSYWLSRSRKDLAERAIVTKRELEEQRSRHWAEVSDHFRKAELQTSIYNSLENSHSSVPPRVNIESLKEEELQEAKLHELEKRRAALSHFLQEEEQILQEEVKQKQLAEKQADPWNIQKMKANLEELQRKQQEERAKMEERWSRLEEEERETERTGDQLVGEERTMMDANVEKYVPTPKHPIPKERSFPANPLLPNDSCN